LRPKALPKHWGAEDCFQNLNLVLSPGVRIGLVGANGSGKTTLLKILEGKMEPNEGAIRRADRPPNRELRAGPRRASQSGDQPAPELCPDGDSVIYRERPIHVAAWAKRFLFRDEQLEMPVSRLSGGERAR